jgi:hypothetical protein
MHSHSSFGVVTQAEDTGLPILVLHPLQGGKQILHLQLKANVGIWVEVEQFLLCKQAPTKTWVLHTLIRSSGLMSPLLCSCCA